MRKHILTLNYLKFDFYILVFTFNLQSWQQEIEYLTEKYNYKKANVCSNCYFCTQVVNILLHKLCDMIELSNLGSCNIPEQ